MSYAARIVSMAGLLFAAGIVGCSNGSTGVTGPVFVKDVPADLAKQINDETAALSRSHPLSSEVADAVRAAVKAVSSTGSSATRDAGKTIREAGFGAVPVIAESLTLQDDVMRIRAISTLNSLTGPTEHRKAGSAQGESLMIKLARRSLRDRSVKVREIAVALLGNVAFQRPNIPAEVKTGLDEALQDADPSVRGTAQHLKEMLGLAPRTHREGEPEFN